MEQLLHSPFRSLETTNFPQLALSVYLPCDSGAGHNYYQDWIKSLARSHYHRLSPNEIKALEREVEIAIRACEKQRFSCPAIALFSSTPNHLQILWRLPEYVDARMDIDTRLHLNPIAEQIKHHPPSLVAIVDKEQARLFDVILSEVHEIQDLQGMKINHFRASNGQGHSFQAQTDEHTKRNLKQVKGAIQKILEEHFYQTLYIAGPVEARAELKNLLPGSTLQKLVAEGPIPFKLSYSQVTERILAMVYDQRLTRPGSGSPSIPFSAIV